MSALTDAEDLARLTAAVTGAPVPGGVPGIVMVTVLERAEGDLVVHFTVEDEQVASCDVGPPEGDADATVTMPATDAADALDGSVSPSVLFMRGRLKVAGSMGVILPLLEATTRHATTA